MPLDPKYTSGGQRSILRYFMRGQARINHARGSPSANAIGPTTHTAPTHTSPNASPITSPNRPVQHGRINHSQGDLALFSSSSHPILAHAAQSSALYTQGAQPSPLDSCLNSVGVVIDRICRIATRLGSSFCSFKLMTSPTMLAITMLKPMSTLTTKKKIFIDVSTMGNRS